MHKGAVDIWNNKFFLCLQTAGYAHRIYIMKHILLFFISAEWQLLPLLLQGALQM
jgi:hypothetical protein